MRPWPSTAPSGSASRVGKLASRPCRAPCAAAPSRSKKVLFATERDESVRAAWRTQIQTLDPEQLVFVDESGTNLAMTPRFGRAKRGQRVVGTAPRNHGPNTTVLAAMSPTGMTAALTVEGAVDRKVFD